MTHVSSSTPAKPCVVPCHVVRRAHRSPGLGLRVWREHYALRANQALCARNGRSSPVAVAVQLPVQPHREVDGGGRHGLAAWSVEPSGGCDHARGRTPPRHASCIVVHLYNGPLFAPPPPITTPRTLAGRPSRRKGDRSGAWATPMAAGLLPHAAANLSGACAQKHLASDKTRSNEADPPGPEALCAIRITCTSARPGSNGCWRSQGTL